MLKNQEEPKIQHGFDRGIDFMPMKEELIQRFQTDAKKYLTSRYYMRVGVVVVYLLISMIQLRNGCRVSEAIDAFKKFFETGYTNKVLVKIGKSEAKKTVWVKVSEDRKEKKQIITKPRYRHIMFPQDWVSSKIISKVFIKLNHTHNKFINTKIIKQKLNNFMRYNFNTNTHSLRYALINHLLFVEKRQQCDVAKFVGHKNVNQLVTYTQNKNCDQIFGLKL